MFAFGLYLIVHMIIGFIGGIILSRGDFDKDINTALNKVGSLNPVMEMFRKRSNFIIVCTLLGIIVPLLRIRAFFMDKE